jgi:hypothetical protein
MPGHPRNRARPGGWILGALLLASGCSGAGPLESVDGFLVASTQGSIPAALLVPHDDPRPWPMDPWAYRGHALDGDTLSLSIQYGGGCGVHRFALLVDPAFRESHPVQVSARLAHDSGGDPCLALIRDELRFDLAPLRRHYQAAYGPGPGVITLVVEGRTISYTF